MASITGLIYISYRHKFGGCIEATLPNHRTAKYIINQLLQTNITNNIMIRTIPLRRTVYIYVIDILYEYKLPEVQFTGNNDKNTQKDL